MTQTSEPTQPTMAVTMDESTIRRVFPAAPADLSVPASARNMFTARMRTLGGEHNTLLRIGWIASFLLGLLVALAGYPAAGIGVVVVAVVVSAGVAWWQHSSATDDFFDRYATARGLRHEEDGHVAADVPLLHRGDVRRFPRVLTGPIAGQDARLGHYTYTEITHDTDSEGNTRERRVDHDFTVLAAKLPPAVAARFRGVYVAPRSISFGALQDKLQHDRRVELESAEFARRYSLRVVDKQDDIALFELFSTPFVHLLATQVEAYWEQRGSDVLFWRKGHQSSAADLDAICLGAAYVLQRYAEEYQ